MSQPLKPGYKQTEVGVIPEEWEVRTIGEMFRLINGCAFKPDDWKPSGTPIIRIQNLNDPSAEFNYSQAPVPERNRIEAGDLLFAWSGTLGSSFGARVWNGPSGVLNQHIFKVLMNEQQITLPFSLLVFARVEEDIAKQAHGFKASFVHVKKSDLVKVDLPLPPLPEQRAIAEALSDVDGLLGGLDRLIAKKRDLKQAAMQQLLTGQTRLPGFHGEWEVKRLGDLKPFVTSGSRGWASYYSETGSLFVRITNMSRGSIYLNLENSKFVNVPAESSEGVRTQLHEHDVLISITADIGIVSYVDSSVPSPAYINQHIALLRFDLATTCSKFVSYFLASEKPQRLFNAKTDTGAKAGMSLPTVQKIEVTLPPLPEQTAIATVLSEMDGELAVLEQRREKTRALKQAMMQELLTGRTRLV